MKFKRVEHINENIVRIEFDELNHYLIIQKLEGESGDLIYVTYNAPNPNPFGSDGLDKEIWRLAGPISKPDQIEIEESPKPPVKCPACSGMDNVRLKGAICQCISCGAIHGTCTEKESWELVKPEFHQGESDPENQAPYDFTILPKGEQATYRRHGWFDKTTKKITQTG